MTSEAGERLDRGAVMPAEDVEAHAKRLGITAERVLRELRGMAFTKISDVVEWEEGLLKLKPVGELSAGQLAAIAEIAASAATGKIYRIKLHDKRRALDLLGRYLRMQPPKTAPNENTGRETTGNEDDPVDYLIAEYDRLARKAGERPGD